MAKIDAEVQAQLEAEPDQDVDLIVRTRGEVTSHLDWLAAEGVQVKQQFRLVPGVAVTCSGATALKMLDQAWVVSIELDKPVKTMGG